MTVLLDRSIRGHPIDTRPARVDPIARAVAGGAVAASLAVVVASWVSGGGITAFAGWSDGLTSVGRLTRLLAADLLLVQVLLMARIPVVERAVGQDRLARWHRLAGFASFTLMAAHIRRVEHVMGMPISLALRGRHAGAAFVVRADGTSGTL